MKQGLLLVAHGARDSHWAVPFEKVAQRIRTQKPVVVTELGFLELMSPSMVQAGQRLVAADCVQVEVLPLFLGTGNHALKGVPALVAELETAHPSVQWRLHPVIGEIDTVVAAMASAAVNLLTQQPDAAQ